MEGGGGIGWPSAGCLSVFDLDVSAIRCLRPGLLFDMRPLPWVFLLPQNRHFSLNGSPALRHWLADAACHRLPHGITSTYHTCDRMSGQ